MKVQKTMEDERMEYRKMTFVCFLAACLLVAWLSPVMTVGPAFGGDRALININTAPVEELTQLPRVGEKVAQRIVAFREKNGPFRRVEDLKAVRGIGDRVFEQIRPKIRVK